MQTIQTVQSKLDLHKQSLLKTCQYLAIFLAWFKERPNSQDFNFYFSIYMKIFHSRKLFRLFKTLFYIPKIHNLILELRQRLTFQAVFDLLGRIFTAIFYVFDNATIISMIMGFTHYKTLRRISHAILFNGIICTTVAVIIELKHSYQQERELRNQLEILGPNDLLKRLSSIDAARKVIWVKIIKAFGDLFPTLARTNVPELIFRTKINKGTVGCFGILSALMKIYLKQHVIDKGAHQHK